MSEYATKRLPELPDVTAPDGSDVRVLLRLAGGGLAHFQLAPGETSTAVRHRTVEEIWYVTEGEGEMWRHQGEHEEVTPLSAGTCLTIPLGTTFQFRATGGAPLSAVAVTMPPWPGEGEAVVASGPWVSTVSG